jgi:hypothetical protein
LGLGLGDRGASAGTYTLSVTGDPGASFAGECILRVGSAEERVELTGPVPLERSFVGDGLSCGLEAVGRVAVELAGGGTRTRSVTTGGTVNISLR